MYEAKYVRSDGMTFELSFANGVIFDIDPLSELDVDISSSQGFGQIGSTVDAQSIAGVSRTVRGRLLGDANTRKNRMLRVFSPLTGGRLIFNGRFFCDCVVKKAPAVSPRRRDAEFSLMLYCPYPYWLAVEETTYWLNLYTPRFSFPVLFDDHIFGERSSSGYTDCRNAGNVPVHYTAEFTSEADVEAYGLTDLLTHKSIVINDTLHAGETVSLGRTDGRVYLRKKSSSGVVTNLMSALDEASTLWTLAPGSNLLKLTADSGQPNLNATITMSPAFTGVYDGMSDI